jgi:hypothetical protein
VRDCPFRNHHADYFGRAFGALDGGGGQHDDELFPAIAGDQIVRAPDAAGDRSGDETEALIAGLMAVKVVERLEVIEEELRPAVPALIHKPHKSAIFAVALADLTP